jgi:hypothetical protein
VNWLINLGLLRKGGSSLSRQTLNAFALKIFLVALIARLVPVLLTQNMGIGLDDMFQYDMLGRSLASGNGYRWYAPQDLARLAPFLHADVAAQTLDPRGILTTFRAPLYPAFVAVIYAVFGTGADRFFHVRLAQAALGALLAPITYFAAGYFWQGQQELLSTRDPERPARLAGWVVALYPMLIVFPLGLATENLFFVLLMGSFLALLALGRLATGAGAEKQPHPQILFYSILAGLLLGLTALTRSVVLPFAAAAVIWIAFLLKQHRAAILAALGMVLVIAPWVLRNSLVSGRLTGIESSMGYNLYVGYHPQSTGTFVFGPSLDLLSILDDQARDAIGTQRAIEFIRADPGRFPYLAMRRLGYFFDVDLRAFVYFYGNGFLGSIPKAGLIVALGLLSLPFAVVSLSAAMGSTTLPSGPPSILLALLFVAYLLPHVLILSEERFHLALIPILSICAAGLWTGGLVTSKYRRWALMLAGAVCGLLMVNWYLEFVRDGSVLAALLGPTGNQLYLPY